MARNVTIKISDEAILWARRKAVEENTSLSRLIGEMLERQMRLSDEYWRAFDHWKSNRPRAAVGAAERLGRRPVESYFHLFIVEFDDVPRFGMGR